MVVLHNSSEGKVKSGERWNNAEWKCHWLHLQTERDEKVQLISRARLLKVEELGGVTQRWGHAAKNSAVLTSTTTSEPSHSQVLRFVGFLCVCVCVIYSELQNTGCKEAVEVNRSNWRVWKELVSSRVTLPLCPELKDEAFKKKDAFLKMMQTVTP